MNTTAPPAGNLYLVVGYDGSPPAIRALDAAVRLLHGRTGSIEVVYVAHLPSWALRLTWPVTPGTDRLGPRVTAGWRPRLGA